MEQRCPTKLWILIKVCLFLDLIFCNESIKINLTSFPSFMSSVWWSSSMEYFLYIYMYICLNIYIYIFPLNHSYNWGGRYFSPTIYDSISFKEKNKSTDAPSRSVLALQLFFCVCTWVCLSKVWFPFFNLWVVNCPAGNSMRAVAEGGLWVVEIVHTYTYTITSIPGNTGCAFYSKKMVSHTYPIPSLTAVSPQILELFHNYISVCV